MNQQIHPIQYNAIQFMINLNLLNVYNTARHDALHTVSTGRCLFGSLKIETDICMHTVYRMQIATDFTWNEYHIVLTPQHCNIMPINFMNCRLLIILLISLRAVPT